MSKLLPACMMPDDADPCREYQEIYAEVESLRQQVLTGIYDASSISATVIKTDELESLRTRLAEADNEATG